MKVVLEVLATNVWCELRELTKLLVYGTGQGNGARNLGFTLSVVHATSTTGACSSHVHHDT